MRVIFCLLFPGLLAMPAALGAQDRFSLDSVVEVREDRSASLSFEQARQGDFQPSDGGAPNFGFTSSAIWLRFQVPESMIQRDSPLLLQLAFPLMDHIDLYTADSQGVYHRRQAGASMKFDERSFEHRTFVFSLAPENQTAPVYMRFVNADSMQLPLIVWAPSAFYEHDHDEQFALGIYYGILLVMAVFNLFAFLILRDRTHLYYTVYVAAFGLFLMSQYGLAYEYLWPAWNHVARSMNPFLASLLEASVLLFTRSFLDTRRTSHRLDDIMRWHIIANLLLAPLAFLVPLSVAALWVVILGLTANVLVVWAGIAAFRSGYRPARFFLVAFAFLVVGAAMYALKTYGLMPVTFLTANGMQIGSALEVTLLTLALVDRMQSLRRATEENQRARIADQTQALQEQHRLTTAYARLLPPEALRLLGKGSILDLQPGDQAQRSMTILFSDIRSFTGMSERMTPSETFSFLNDYLARMNPAIRANNGYIDKYIGDGIMALFPESPTDAIRAAVAMRAVLSQYNLDRAAVDLPAVEMGVGIHTGEIMLGALGETERLEVTAISDAVNIAARLESLTARYGAAILITESAFQQCANPDEFHYRLVDHVRPRGRDAAIAILEVLDGLPAHVLKSRLQTRAIFERGVNALLNENWRGARCHLEEALAIEPADQAVAVHLARIASMVQASSLPAQSF